VEQQLPMTRRSLSLGAATAATSLILLLMLINWEPPRYTASEGLSASPPGMTVSLQSKKIGDGRGRDSAFVHELSLGRDSSQHVRILDEASALPIAGASIAGHETSGEEWKHFGTSDSDGRFELPDSPDMLDALLVSAEGYFAKSVMKAQLPLKDLGEITLERSTPIGGRVQTSDGIGVPNVTLLAVPHSTRKVTAPIRKAAEGLSTVPRAVSRPDGSFFIHGALPTVEYNIHAGGRGLLPVSVETTADAIRPGVTDLVVTVGRAYGALVSVREVGGGSLRCSEELWSRKRLEWLAPPDLVQHYVGSPSAFLAMEGIWSAGYRKVYETWLPISPDGTGILALVYTLPEPALNHVTLRMSLPGYEPMTEDVPLRPIVNDFPRHEIEIRPTGGFGELSLLVTDAADRIPSRLAGLGFIEIAYPGTERTPWLYKVTASGEKRLQGVPSGEARVDFLPVVGKAIKHSTAGYATIGKEPYVYVVELAEYSTLDVEPMRGGLPYSERLTLEIVPRGTVFRGHQDDTYLFDQPPYHFPTVVPGDYTLRVRYPPTERTTDVVVGLNPAVLQVYLD